MDGLLFLLLLYWLFKKLVKGSKKKTTAKAAAANQRPAHMAEGIKRARQEKQLPMQDLSPQPVSEGESNMGYTQDAHGCVSQQMEYLGSMMAASSEGEDACEPELDHERTRIVEPESVYANEIGSGSVLDFSARGIYQGVVMSEILARPARRMHRRT